MPLEANRLALQGHSPVGLDPAILEVWHQLAGCLGQALLGGVARQPLPRGIHLKVSVVDRLVLLIEVDLAKGEAFVDHVQQGAVAVLTLPQGRLGLQTFRLVAEDAEIARALRQRDLDGARFGPNDRSILAPEPPTLLATGRLPSAG